MFHNLKKDLSSWDSFVWIQNLSLHIGYIFSFTPYFKV